MKTLFFRTLFSSIAGLFLFLAILAMFLFIGFGRSLDSWSSNKLEEIQNGVEQKLLDPEAEVSFPENISVFIYNVDKQLIFSNRGEGKKRSFDGDGDVNRVVKDGRLIGYYHAGNIAFQNDYANQQFVSSMIQTMWIGALASCLLSILYALVFSRGLARPARAAAEGIAAISEGNLDREIPENGAEEIAGIAHAANALREQLKKERLLRSQWAEDVAHDLRTPISALKAQFEGMRDGVLPLNKERIVQNLGEIQRVESLINDLQELMQLENPELVPSVASVQLDELFGSIAAAFSYQAANRGAVLTVDGHGVEMFGDEDLLHRAITNVVSNAIRHVDQHGKVELMAVQSGPEVKIVVRNSGDLIPADEIGRLFDRLFRGDRARNSPGTGLGLTITKQIVELHRGTIDITSTPQDGTIVQFHLHRNFTRLT